MLCYSFLGFSIPGLSYFYKVKLEDAKRWNGMVVRVGSVQFILESVRLRILLCPVTLKWGSSPRNLKSLYPGMEFPLLYWLAGSGEFLRTLLKIFGMINF